MVIRFCFLIQSNNNILENIPVKHRAQIKPAAILNSNNTKIIKCSELKRNKIIVAIFIGNWHEP